MIRGPRTPRNGTTAVGGRKTAVARVLLQPGTGNVIVGGRPMEEYFPRLLWQNLITLPLRITNTHRSFNVLAKVTGGGITGQAAAITHGIARALVKIDEAHRVPLRQAGLLTRDSRAKERKKPGLKRARKAPQYTKR
ncbi:MAG TPA: 30S ribosomal protein S9 [Chloroflexota bacterium]|nr:30S ribosomal protein S9 [Chloroflexota bacterium]